MKKQSGTKKYFRHWNSDQDFLYNLFLVMYNKELTSSDIKRSGFFVSMSDFIQTKSKTQCRSHHQKKIKSIREKKNIEDRKQLELINIQTFFKTSYLKRFWGTDHLIKQLKIHFQRKIKAGHKNKKQYQRCFDEVQAIVEGLHLEQNIVESDEQSSQVPSSDESAEPQIEQIAPPTDDSRNHSSAINILELPRLQNMVNFQDKNQERNEARFFEEESDFQLSSFPLGRRNNSCQRYYM